LLLRIISYGKLQNDVSSQSIVSLMKISNNDVLMG